MEWNEQKTLEFNESIVKMQEELLKVLPKKAIESHAELNRIRGGITGFKEVMGYLSRNLVTGSHDVGKFKVLDKWKSEEEYGVNQSGLWSRQWSGGRVSVDGVESFIRCMDKDEFVKYMDALEKKIVDLDLRTKKRSIARVKKMRSFIEENWDTIKGVLTSNNLKQQIILPIGAAWIKGGYSDAAKVRFIDRAINFTDNAPVLTVNPLSKSEVEDLKLSKEKGKLKEFLKARQESVKVALGKTSSYSDNTFSYSHLHDNMEAICMWAGAIDYLPKAFDDAKVEQSVQRKKIDEIEGLFKREFGKEILAVAATKMSRGGGESA